MGCGTPLQAGFARLGDSAYGLKCSEGAERAAEAVYS